MPILERVIALMSNEIALGSENEKRKDGNDIPWTYLRRMDVAVVVHRSSVELRRRKGWGPYVVVVVAAFVAVTAEERN